MSSFEKRIPPRFAVCIFLIASFFFAAIVACRPSSNPVSSETQVDSSPSADSILQECRTQQSPKLELRGVVGDSVVCKIADLDWLRDLQLYRTQFRSLDLAWLKKLTALESLRLEDLRLVDEQVPALLHLSKLRVLNLPKAALTDQGLKQLASGLPKLELLRVGSPNITDNGLIEVAALKSLRFLHLVNVPVTDLGLEAFREMHQLESLYIDGGKETEAGIRALLKSNPNLHFHRNQTHVANDPRADGH